jgi:metal-responsive CopG/Arc/MetJ family transcriptional regulator
MPKVPSIDTPSLVRPKTPRRVSVTFLIEPEKLVEIDALSRRLRAQRSETLRRLLRLGVERARSELESK